HQSLVRFDTHQAEIECLAAAQAVLVGDGERDRFDLADLHAARRRGMRAGSQFATASSRSLASGWPRNESTLRISSPRRVGSTGCAPVCLESVSPAGFSATGACR